MKLHIMQFSTASYYFLAIREKYHLQHPILEHHSPNPSLTVKNSVSNPCTTIFNIRVLCFNLYELGYKVGRLKDSEYNSSKDSQNLICSLFLHAYDSDLRIVHLLKYKNNL